MLLGGFFLGGILVCCAQEEPSSISFSRQVAPVLASNCVTCHGPGQQQSQLDLSTRASILKGGQKGPALIPGDAVNSVLYRRITGQQQPAMPLGGKLTDAEIAILKKWIDAGAAWEGGALTPPEPPKAVAREKVFSERERNWWAFRKPVRHPVPPIADRRWSSHPIDAFIKKALDEKGLQPAPAADRRTLIRRAYLDLDRPAAAAR